MTDSEIINNLNYYIYNLTTSDETTVDIYNRWILDNNIVNLSPELTTNILEQIEGLKKLDKELYKELLD